MTIKVWSTCYPEEMNLRERKWLELFKDYDLSISYQNKDTMITLQHKLLEIFLKLDLCVKKKGTFAYLTNLWIQLNLIKRIWDG